MGKSNSKKKNRKKIVLIYFGTLAIVVLLMPILSPVLFTDASPRGALRHELYKEGYFYQSYFAIITEQDPQAERYHMFWYHWKSETGGTPFVCYSKKVSEEKYAVSCGTGP